jgi:hypothetical protein
LLAVADEAATITVTVTATNGAGSASVTSTGVGPVAAAPSALWSLTTPITLVGDSITWGDNRMKSFGHWLPFMAGGKLRVLPINSGGTDSSFGYNAGRSGNSTAQMAARVATFGTHNGVYILLTGENDNNSVTAGDQQASLTTIFTALSAAKKIYVVPFPTTKTVDTNATIATRNTTNMAWLNAYGGNVEVVTDAWSGIALSDGSGGTGADSIEGIHPNTTGAYKLAQNIWNHQADQWAAGTVADHWTAMDYNTNVYDVDFTGTGGTVPAGASGQMATGLTLQLSGTTGLTVVAEKTTLGGFDAQKVTISGTAAASGTIQVNIRNSSSHTFAIGDAFAFSVRARVESAAGGDPTGVLAVGFEPAGGRGAFLSRYAPINEGGLPLRIDGTGRGMSEPMPASGSSITSDFAIRFIPGASVDATITVANVQIYNVADEGDPPAEPEPDPASGFDDGFDDGFA